MPAPRIDPSAFVAVLRRNRQFVAAVAAVLVGITVLAGDPRAPVPAVADFDPGSGPAATGTLPVPDGTDAPSSAPPAGSLPAPAPVAPPPSPDGDDVAAPPAPPPPPPPPPGDDGEVPSVECELDEELGVPVAAEATQQTRGVRDALQALAGDDVPGESVLRFVEIAAGCRSGDELGGTIDILLELAELMPDHGLPTIPLPALPRIPPPPLPDEARAALSPLKPIVDPACAQLGTLTLLLVVLAPAFNVPLNQGDMIALLDPAVAVCAMFDDVPAADGDTGSVGVW